MELPIYQVDAFASGLFQGNPAAVVPLECWLPDAAMQSIAAENNLAETAFFVRDGERYHLRWFTPAFEIDLCGHATLASAHVIARILRPGLPEVVFDTRSGELRVVAKGDLLELDFPARPPVGVTPMGPVVEALGGAPEQVLAARDYFVVYRTAAEVAALRPDMGLLEQCDKFGFIATAPGENCDFVSRFFAPAAGVPEDPVTGSAHCTLIPYWAERLGRTELFARQISARGGELWCSLRGDRVTMAGKSVLYLRGTIEV
jgi:predicted PhzF superfamily epimerase YddE/YHI9